MIASMPSTPTAAFKCTRCGTEQDVRPDRLCPWCAVLLGRFPHVDQTRAVAAQHDREFWPRAPVRVVPAHLTRGEYRLLIKRLRKLQKKESKGS
jgi:NMD protein affecting ribosome stability and mRNA decay